VCPQQPKPSGDSSKAANGESIGSAAVGDSAAADPKNRHIEIFRYSVAGQSAATIRKLESDGVLLCLKCETLRRIPETGPGEKWEGGAGSAMWNRVGVEYKVENLSSSAAELMLVEMKDSYGISQMRVPSTERDPLLMGAQQYRVMLENEHARVLLLRLRPREGTEESQFALRLEIALTDMHAFEKIAGGERTEVSKAAGQATWKTNELKSIVNTGDRALDEVIVELKHPFCYNVVPETEPEDKNPDIKRYFTTSLAKMNKLWLKKMPGSVRDGQTGMLRLKLKIQSDGTLRDDDVELVTVFATEALVEKAVAAVRDAGSLPPIPPSAGKPTLDFRLAFLYNLPREARIGCR